jgi:acyl-[acyl-carrier-protein]-phospholipid O-acyltransferase/long-chain-fatty-acid--[acyl-carrier-protein] ligase
MALPGSSFKIVDPHTLEELPTGEAGMIIIGGAQVMKGYLNNPALTDEVIKEGYGERWYVSGDKGYLDEDGYLTIVDRYSRFAKIGGEMVSLGQVEELIRACQQEDEFDIVAVSIPDERKGERIALLTDKAVDERSIRQRLLANGLSPLMIPDKWFMVDVLPKLGSGKTDFTLAKSIALRLAGLDSPTGAGT